MARDRNRSEDQMSEPQRNRRSDMDPMEEEQVRGGLGDDLRGIAGDEDEEFEDAEDLDEEEDSEGSI